MLIGSVSGWSVFWAIGGSMHHVIWVFLFRGEVKKATPRIFRVVIVGMGAVLEYLSVATAIAVSLAVLAAFWNLFNIAGKLPAWKGSE